MSNMLIFAIVSMTLALVFYSIGVWGERLQNRLTWTNVVFFFLGFTSDSIGTHLMVKIAEQLGGVSTFTFKDYLHTITGGLALFLMFVHLVWAIYVRALGSEHAKVNFHKFSIVVWSFWLIPYFLGMIIGMFN